MKQTRTKAPSESKFLIGKRIESLDELMAQEWICFDYCPELPLKEHKIYNKSHFWKWTVCEIKRYIKQNQIYAASKAVEIPVHIIKTNHKSIEEIGI